MLLTSSSLWAVGESVTSALSPLFAFSSSACSRPVCFSCPWLAPCCGPSILLTTQVVLEDVISRPENFSGEVLLRTRRRLGISEVVAGGMHLDVYQLAIQVTTISSLLLLYLAFVAASTCARLSFSLTSFWRCRPRRLLLSRGVTSSVPTHGATAESRQQTRFHIHVHHLVPHASNFC